MPKKENNDRKWPGARGPRPDRKAERKLSADARAANVRTPVAQIAHLDACGFKATKERAKLFARIEAAKSQPKADDKSSKERRHNKSKVQP